jgi:hypothetical protein
MLKLFLVFVGVQSLAGMIAGNTAKRKGGSTETAARMWRIGGFTA